MPAIVHLSDLHLMSDQGPQAQVLDALVQAVGAECDQLDVGLLAFTGDIFECATLTPKEATAAFVQLLDRLEHALGGPVPTVIVPGNHDRRQLGVIGPHRTSLFEALEDALRGRAFVHGNQTPFLSHVLDPKSHGLDAWVLAYDSTWLPGGLLSAGGEFRQEDLLRAASQIGSREPDWPVVMLVHHHIVPTPFTDLEAFDGRGTSWPVRFAMQSLLPRIVSHGDRGENAASALGAGTALSTLHSLGRAVVVLHGHKHFATARLINALREGEGDVMLVSAGSGGTAQAWTHGTPVDGVRLWPTFNIAHIEQGAVRVDQVSFGYRGSSTGARVMRPMIRAQRSGSRWIRTPVAPDDPEEPRLELNESIWNLVPGESMPQLWDAQIRRLVVPTERGPRAYIEEPLAEPYSSFVDEHGLPVATTSLELSLEEPTVYSAFAAARRAMDGGRQSPSSPYGSIAFMNRYAAERARLVVRGLLGHSDDAFASTTDLGTGLERPLPLGRDGDSVFAEQAGCPARTLLRIYWPLARA